MFSFTRSRSRLRVVHYRSRSRPKTGRLRNPGFLACNRSHNTLSKFKKILEASSGEWTKFLDVWLLISGNATRDYMVWPNKISRYRGCCRQCPAPVQCIYSVNDIGLTIWLLCCVVTYTISGPSCWYYPLYWVHVIVQVVDLHTYV